MKLILCIGILLIIFGSISTNASESHMVESNLNPTLPVKPMLLQYETHAPIKIMDEFGFIELGVPGSGTQQSPYIIEGFIITGSETVQNLIQIENVNSHFIIRNNYFVGNGALILNEQMANYYDIQKIINVRYADSHFIIKDNYFYANGSTGIYLVSTNSVSVENNIMVSPIWGIHTSSSQISIINNSISNSQLTAITVSGVIGSKILNNTIYNSKENGISIVDGGITISNNLIEDIKLAGILASSSSETTTPSIISFNVINNALYGIQTRIDNSFISNNEILNSRGNGIYMDSYSGYWPNRFGNNTFSNNRITNTNMHGVAIISSSGSKFLHNEIINSGFSGISISGDYLINYWSNGVYGPGELPSNENVFEYNNIHGSEDYGVRLGYYSDNNSFRNNNFIGNGKNDVQGYDENGLNIFEYNYWDNWIQPDTDRNGIIDQPYEFDNNSDKYPLMEPNTGEEFRPIQTQEIVQAPTENGAVNTVKRTITITETETIIPVQTVINQKSYNIPSITLFIVFSIIGIITVSGKNPVYNKFRSKIINVGEDVLATVRPSHVQNMNLNIHCTACGTTNPPLSLFCMECGVSQDN